MGAPSSPVPFTRKSETLATFCKIFRYNVRLLIYLAIYLHTTSTALYREYPLQAVNTVSNTNLLTHSNYIYSRVLSAIRRRQTFQGKYTIAASQTDDAGSVMSICLILTSKTYNIFLPLFMQSTLKMLANLKIEAAIRLARGMT